MNLFFLTAAGRVADLESWPAAGVVASGQDLLAVLRSALEISLHQEREKNPKRERGPALDVDTEVTLWMGNWPSILKIPVATSIVKTWSETTHHSFPAGLAS